MNLLQINIKALIPTNSGCAVFLTDGVKIIHFFIDLQIGETINSELAGVKAERPLTHDLFCTTLSALGGSLTKVIINDREGDVFYAKTYWEMQNEVMVRKIVEVDSRPSDSLALAVRQKCPLYISKDVWEETEDVTSLLKQLEDTISGDSDGFTV